METNDMLLDEHLAFVNSLLEQAEEDGFSLEQDEPEE